MGIEILAGRPILQVLPEKQARVAAATEAMLEKGVASASKIEHLLGIWISMMLSCRTALSIPAAIYAFMRDFAEQPAQKLRRAVQAELWCLVFLLPLFAVDLSAGWHPPAYQIDVSHEELFSASGRLSAAVRDAALSWVEVWDILLGLDHDLTEARIAAELLQRVKHAVFWHAHMEPTCATFSVARNPAVRSKEHLCRLPGLCENDRKKVAIRTLFAHYAI